MRDRRGRPRERRSGGSGRARGRGSRRSRRNGPRETSLLRYDFSTTFAAMLRLGATPVVSRSSGTWATPARIAARGSPLRSALAGDPNRPGGERPHPGERLRELALPVARDARDARGSRPLEAERRRPATRRPRGRRGRSGPPPRARCRRARPGRGARATSTWRPTISDASSSRVTSAVGDRRDRAAAAQDRHAVGDGHHLVQLVRDEDDRPLFGGHGAERRRTAPPPPAA